MSPATRSQRTVLFVLIGAVLAALLGCTPSTPQSSSAEPSSGLVSFSDTYVKSAAKGGEMAMSAVFGVLDNSSDQDVTLVSATSDAATTVEMHEMVMKDGAMKMQPKEGGFVVPAGKSTTLEPGGLHIMLIGLTRDIRAGDTVTTELTFSDGTQLSVDAIGRDLPNANESYEPQS